MNKPIYQTKEIQPITTIDGYANQWAKLISKNSVTRYRLIIKKPE